MQSVEIDGLEELDRKFAELIDNFPDKRRELHERIAQRLDTEVKGAIAGAGLNDSGKIAGWQTQHVGSGGGYAAERAVKGATGPDSPGAITNYLENGHRIRPPGKTKPRATVPYVNGYHFYKTARAKADSIAVEETEKLLEEIKSELEQ